VQVLVVADSTAFHGPEQAELLTHPGLYPNVLARELGGKADVVARLGWTARDAWWALTKDPLVYSVLAPRADAVVLGVGGCDHLPASLPTYLKEGIAYLRPEWLRSGVRAAYHRAHPHVVRATGGRMRVLPQRETLRYLTKSVEALRYLRPERPVVGIVPPPYDARYHGHVSRPHDQAVAAHRAWAATHAVPVVDLHELVEPHLRAGSLNSDGMHWSWEVHELVGKAFASVIAELAG
jgi:diglucosylglycerate octanoyltransferase